MKILLTALGCPVNGRYFDNSPVIVMLIAKRLSSADVEKALDAAHLLRRRGKPL